MSSVPLTWLLISGYISNSKTHLPIQTIYIITFHINLLRLWVTDVKFFIPKYQQYTRYIAKPASDGFAATNIESEILGLLIKKLKAMNFDCVSNLSLKQWQQLMKKTEKVAQLLSIADKLFRFFFRRLLYFAIIIFFFIAST